MPVSELEKRAERIKRKSKIRKRVESAAVSKVFQLSSESDGYYIRFLFKCVALLFICKV